MVRARLHLPARPHPDRAATGRTSPRTACTSPSPTPAGRRRPGARSTASGSAGTAVFVYDYDASSCPKNMLSVITKYKLTTFCAPPTIYRFLIKEDLNAVRLPHLEVLRHRRRAAQPRGLQPVVARGHRHQAHGGLRPDRNRGHGRHLPLARAQARLDGQALARLRHRPPQRRRQALRGRRRRARSSSAPTSASPSGMFQGYYRDDGAHQQRSGTTASTTPATWPGATRTATTGSWAAPTT